MLLRITPEPRVNMVISVYDRCGSSMVLILCCHVGYIAMHYIWMRHVLELARLLFIAQPS